MCGQVENEINIGKMAEKVRMEKIKKYRKQKKGFKKKEKMQLQ